ncbi:hypothetical protein KAR91_50270 [Candidatus Pacearchaeota archaeon]|nr:hypothetical protein [Candidatus Pacearchaeota archaeon]
MGKTTTCDRKTVPARGSVVRKFNFQQSDDEGGFSHYFKISKNRGIKIIHSFVNDSGGGFQHAGVGFLCPSTPEELIELDLWKKAVEEFDLMVKAQHLPYVPNVYRVIPCKVVGYIGQGDKERETIYLPGIIMDHIPYPDLYTAVPDSNTRSALSEEIERITKKDGLYLKDHYGGCNALGQPDKSVKPWGIRRWWIIDFTPGYVRVVKRRKKSNGKKN